VEQGRLLALVEAIRVLEPEELVEVLFGGRLLSARELLPAGAGRPPRSLQDVASSGVEKQGNQEERVGSRPQRLPDQPWKTQGAPSRGGSR
jgi:hypothetical protein